MTGLETETAETSGGESSKTPINKMRVNLTIGVYLIYVAGLVALIPEGQIEILTVAAWFLALVLAYYAKDADASWIDSHHTFQIRTFFYIFIWLTCLILIQAAYEVLFDIEDSSVSLIFLILFLWLALRCAKGISLVAKNKPISEPKSLFLGG